MFVRFWRAGVTARLGLGVGLMVLIAMLVKGIDSAALMQLMNVPLGGVLHAEQAFDHLAPVHVGDVLELTRRVERIFDKKDGALTFIVVDTD